ncbi:MAG: SDR family oxidoreductase [Deltaproteobacteria bacterium]|nr:SDR family oxidoreductase [Deltaproteobacteria bacterium]
MANMKSKRVLITGAAGGIGFCLAEECARAGCVLVITDINESKLDEAAAKLRATGATAHARRMDVTRKEDADEMAKWVIDELGGLDVLVNNAGVGFLAELAETRLDDWKRLMDVNFMGPLYLVYAFLPWMIEHRHGHIVNVSSGQAFFRLPTWGAYATIKLALGAFSELLAVEIRKYDIRVTTVYPFMVNTGFYGDIKGETFMAKLSMKLVPYYSMSPQTVGRIIFRAIEKQKKVEMVSLINDLGYFTRFVPPIADIIGYTANLFLTKNADHAPAHKG